MFFENFEFWISFGKFLGNCFTYNFRQNTRQRDFVRVFFRGLILFVISQSTNSFVLRFYGYNFDISNWDTINSLGLIDTRSCKSLFCRLLLFFKSKKSGLLSLIEPIFLSFSFSKTNMCVYNADSRVRLLKLIFNPLQLMLSHFLRDCSPEIVWSIVDFIFLLLLLDLYEIVNDPKNSKNFSYVLPVNKLYIFLRRA